MSMEHLGSFSERTSIFNDYSEENRLTLFGKSTPPIQDDSSMKEFYHQLSIKNKPNIPLKRRDYMVVFAKQVD